MKPFIERGISAYQPKFCQGTSTYSKCTEVIYQCMNQDDTNRIARMKEMDEHYRPHLKN